VALFLLILYFRISKLFKGHLSSYKEDKVYLKR